jgi:hypothetical protein
LDGKEIRTESPDILLASGVLHEPTSRSLEDTVTLEGGKPLELRRQGVENASVEGRSLGYASGILIRDRVHLGRTNTLQECLADPCLELGVGSAFIGEI